MPTPKTQKWTSKMESLYESEVHLKVTKHDLTTHTGHLNPLGFPYNHIQRNILKSGRADFKKGYKHDDYGEIDKYDKALLYCYFNLRGHFHSSVAHFTMDKDYLLEELFEDVPYIIDVGCGPATSALALAEVFPGEPFRYLGIDSALAMRDRGKTLTTAAQRSGIIHKDSTFSFYASWTALPPIPKTAKVMFNFAFFFASDSLDDDALGTLAAKLTKIGEGQADRQAIISYTNSINPLSGVNYEKFLDVLEWEPKEGRTIESVTYANSLTRGGAPKSQEYSRELYPAQFS